MSEVLGSPRYRNASRSMLANVHWLSAIRRAKNPRWKLWLVVVYSAILMVGSLGCEPSKKKDGKDYQPATSDQVKGEASSEPKTKMAAESPTPSANPEASEGKPKTLAEWNQRAGEELDQGKVEEAWKSIQKAMLMDSNHVETIFLAARIMAARGKTREAVGLLDQIPTDHPEAGLAALGQSAEWFCQIGDLSSAEKRLRQLLEKAPGALPAHRLLVRVLNVQGRRWESRSHLYELVRGVNFNRDEIVMMIDYTEPFIEKEFYETATKFKPDDPLLKLGTVRHHIYKNRFVDAENLLREINRAQPEFLEAWVWLGHVLAAQEKLEALVEWHQQTPKGYTDHPQYWFVRGRWSELNGDYESACHAYSKTLLFDPRHLGACSRLADSLLQIGEIEAAERIRQRATLIAELTTIAQETIRKSSNEEATQRMIAGFRELGDPFIAYGWEMILAAEKKDTETLKKLGLSLRQLAKETSNPDGKSIVDPLSIDRWKLADVDVRMADSPANLDRSLQEVPFALEDVAAQVGLNARYNNSKDMSQPGMLIFEGNGGGVGVIDYDLDGFVDLYCSTAGGKPSAREGHQPKTLWRSFGGKSFSEVASMAMSSTWVWDGCGCRRCRSRWFSRSVGDEFRRKSSIPKPG